VPHSAVVSSSAVADLFGEARRIMSAHYNPRTLLRLPFVSFIYLLRVLLSTWVSRSG
jgi:ABC-type arginine/histidine transport system permease subunit